MGCDISVFELAIYHSIHSPSVKLVCYLFLTVHINIDQLFVQEFFLRLDD